MVDIVSFLEGKTPNHRGYTHAMLLEQTDQQAETTHDYIQWLFPLDRPSQSVNTSPVLTKSDVQEIRQNQLIGINLEKSKTWFLGFLERNKHWITKYDHNHLRITRAIISLRLLVSDKTAENFRKKIFELAGNRLNSIDSKAINFWNKV